MQYDPALAWASLPQLLRGAAMTLGVLAPVLAIGLLMALPVALRRARWMGRAWLATSYVAVFRGVPSLILLYAIYNGLPQFSIIRDGPLWPLFSNAYFCAVLGLSLTHSGYMAEILRGGLQAVPPGIVEAAQALGMRPAAILWTLRLPLAARYALRAYQNEVLIMVKSTAAVGAITIMDLTASANQIFEFTYDPFTPLLSAAALYWAVINLIRFGFDRADKRLAASSGHLFA